MILVVSYPGEDHTAAVVDRLREAGREVVQIDLADYPAGAGVAFEYHGDGGEWLLGTTDGAVDLKRCQAVWWRRVRPFAVDPVVTGAEDRAFAMSETQQAIGGVLTSLTCPWMNPSSADEAAHRKPLQWSVARSVGLSVPRTLVTSRVDRAREFVRELGCSRTVFKPFLAVHQSWRETRLVGEADLRQLDSVRLAPVIFQEFVPGVDLRVTIVGDTVLAAEIDATETIYPVDMRMVVGDARVRDVTLPTPLGDALLRLMRRLGLVYGAIDLRRRSDGEYRFLEVNPAGQWLFVEQRTGLPITEAVATKLMELASLGARQAARA